MDRVSSRSAAESSLRKLPTDVSALGGDAGHIARQVLVGSVVGKRLRSLRSCSRIGAPAPGLRRLRTRTTGPGASPGTHILGTRLGRPTTGEPQTVTSSTRYRAHRSRAETSNYHWRLIPLEGPAPEQVIVLLPHDRDAWPQLVRKRGVDRLEQIAFLNVRERAMFALDCDFVGQSP